MIIRLKYILAMILLIGSHALIPTYLWAEDITESPSEVLESSSSNTSTNQTAENCQDLPYITYPDTDTGFKIKVCNIPLNQVVDFTLNGEIITNLITQFVMEKEIIQVTQEDKGFELHIAMPIYLLNGAEFGIILNNGSKLSRIIDEDNRGLSPIRLNYSDFLTQLGYIFGWGGH